MINSKNSLRFTISDKVRAMQLALCTSKRENAHLSCHKCTICAVVYHKELSRNSHMHCKVAHEC